MPVHEAVRVALSGRQMGDPGAYYGQGNWKQTWRYMEMLLDIPPLPIRVRLIRCLYAFIPVEAPLMQYHVLISSYQATAPPSSIGG